MKPRQSLSVQALDVDNAAFNKFSYGVEILTTNVDGKDYGCVINTAGQVAAGDPKKITISVIKKNNTCDMVAKAENSISLSSPRTLPTACSSTSASRADAMLTSLQTLTILTA